LLLLLLVVLLPTGAGPPPSAAAPRTSAHASSGAAGPGQAKPAGTVWESVRVDGQLRRYLLSVPPGLRTRAPLVLAFHGLGQRAGSFAAATGLVPATRAAGQVLALPECLGPAFNDGRLGARGPRDDAFATALIDRLAGTGLIDPRRVVITGFSNGAGMAMEVAGRHPRAIAAVVSIDGALIAAPGAPRPTGPVPAYLVHGTADRIQPWDGRRAAGPTWPAYISQPATVAAWVRADGAGTTSARTIAGADGHGDVTVHSWAPGPSGAGVTFYVVAGMGHRWPLVTSGPGGRGRDAIDATAIVVQTATSAVLAGS
jgi:polyhydroxybutyrate depolymerase